MELYSLGRDASRRGLVVVGVDICLVVSGVVVVASNNGRRGILAVDAHGIVEFGSDGLKIASIPVQPQSLRKDLLDVELNLGWHIHL